MHKKIRLILSGTLMCMLSMVIFDFTSLSARALTPVTIDNSIINNQVIEISENINENEKTLKELSNKIKETNSQIDIKLKYLTDTKKDSQDKRSFLSIDSNNKFDNLKMFELVLKSDNISELMSNLKLTKSFMVVKSQSLKTLNDKEEILTIEYSGLLNKLENLNNEKKDLNEEQKRLKEQLKEIEDEIAKLTNFNSTTIGEITYNPNNLLQPSNIDVDTLKYLLKDTKLYSLAPTYVQIEKEYGINALFIVGISALESGWGTSKRAVEDNNLTGFGVYHDNSKGLNAQTKEDNLVITAKTLKNSYLSVGGNLYTGVTINDVNAKYCIGYDGLPDFNWSLKINTIVEKLLSQLKED